MLRAFKTPRPNDRTVFYFGETDTPKTKDNIHTVLLGVGAASALLAVTLLVMGSGDGDERILGTDRPAGEDETERRARERENGPSREASDDVREYRRWGGMSDEEMLAYYREHYDGVSRGKLAVVDNGFYNGLRKRGLIEHIPTRYQLWEQKFFESQQ